ncbi:MAG TPA: hypothetical protein VN018_07860 [Brevundimonas sp.]|nr:hypothetical protein [Brevundimonas sp.]
MTMGASDKPFAPLLVSDRSDITSALTQRRHDLGLSGEELDEIAGFSERYVSKLEVPMRAQGKLGFRFDQATDVTPTGVCRPSGMASIWMAALGVALVLVDQKTADSIGAVAAPKGPVRFQAGWTGGNASDGHRIKRRLKGRHSAMTLPAFEVADRSEVAALSFSMAVTSHEFLANRPALQAQAEDIERRLRELADLIREAA